ncbi:murein DD-endopeptidase MepM/ murein hydrolase activator NlpD [Okibacterium sp. HSC-33S16]|uniref:murein hydrolase activator EnvC family protein n=1 Tax=Okibacterium sp. HSC-33S16 TaxID=2910965 RepID=UPI0020A073A1|nr:M23 family metallopeptidase [Okibacterium sp. HSC-33S16]MCP2030574.1 murein DD-endopeptidase MepM/ murein hydrolase activator NlpD [Okibacterium sp. HSC-33S16]
MNLQLGLRIALICYLAATSSPTVGTAGPVDSGREHTGASAGPRWLWPVDGERAVLRPFEAPATPYAAGHRGVDLRALPTAVLVAPADGVVSFAGTVVDRPVLSITSPGGLVASIEPIAASVRDGDTVAAGDAIGVVAAGGHCSGRCVHFGVRLHGEYVNPFVLLETVPRAVLLPVKR